MLIEPKLRKWFHDYVKSNNEIPNELKHSLTNNKNSPRYERFIKRLSYELNQAIAIAEIKNGKPLAHPTIKGTAHDMFNIFIAGLMIDAHKMYETESARLARQAEIDKQKEFEAAISNKADGELAEAGIIFVDDREGSYEKENQKGSESRA